MKLKSAVAECLLLLLPLLLGSGCMTAKLWDNGNLEAWKQPAIDPHLHLYDAKSRPDVLVVYDEYSDRHDTTHTRAYWLNESEKRVEQGHAPRFVSPSDAQGLATVPVFCSPPDESRSRPPFYALVATNHQSFTLYSENGQISSHDLPTYNDGQGKVEKFLLTPAALTADATIVGGILGYTYLAMRCGADPFQ
jgi:hypothetical protein